MGDIRKHKVEEATSRIAAGYYDSPEYDRAVVRLLGKLSRALKRLDDGDYADPCFEERVVRRMLMALQRCPFGDGTGWRDGLYDLLPKCFHGAVDDREMANSNTRETTTRSGRIDFAMPLHLRKLGVFKLLEIWAIRYQISSIIVEAKNTQRKAGVGDVRQLLCYLREAGMGRLGIMVSRRGFSKPATRYLAKLAREKEFLIIPFDLGDVEAFAYGSLHGKDEAMDFLERKERTLLRVG